MTSILESNSTTVQVKDLSLVFPLKYHLQQTWRDVFVNAVKNPINTFLTEGDRLVVLDNISFDLMAGERVGIIGVNGAGKTSLCRVLAGIYGPTRGKITIKGSVKAVFDTGIGIQPELTGRENAMLLAEFLFPNEVENHKDIIKEALEFSELGHFVDTPYKFYSNGMQARLCLSLISARSCDLLLLDEVFDGADQFFRAKIADRVRKMIEKAGTVVFVSHSFEQIKEVCNRVLVLHKSKICYDGNPADGNLFYQSLMMDPQSTKP